MKRFSIIIGCAGLGDDHRPGIEKDVDNFIDYLKSNKGGAWYDDEILPLKNKNKDTILSAINEARNKYDYMFVVFSGHGNYFEPLSARRLYTNENKYFFETELQGLAPKQLVIIDSCAGITQRLFESDTTKSFAAESIEDKSLYRYVYENLISNCPAQSIVLYSCENGEESQDSGNGGLYAYNLIKAAKNSVNRLNCLDAHTISKPIVTQMAKSLFKRQNPTYISSCKHGNVLPFSIGEL
jgi:hypothetical protein